MKKMAKRRKRKKVELMRKMKFAEKRKKEINLLGGKFGKGRM